MERLLLFCVFDNKVEGYLPPFTAQNRAVAARIFESAIMREGSDFGEHAEDYSVWETGVFDPSTGMSVPRENGKKILLEAYAVINKYKNAQEGHESV